MKEQDMETSSLSFPSKINSSFTFSDQKIDTPSNIKMQKIKIANFYIKYLTKKLACKSKSHNSNIPSDLI